MTMSTGEFDFDVIFRQDPTGESDDAEEIPFPAVSYILWIIFVILMPVLLTNMLVCRKSVLTLLFLCCIIRLYYVLAIISTTRVLESKGSNLRLHDERSYILHESMTCNYYQWTLNHAIILMNIIILHAFVITVFF